MLRKIKSLTFTVVAWPVKTVAHAVSSIRRTLVNRYRNPSVEYLVAADFGSQFAFAIVAFIYAIVFLFAGTIGWAIFFGVVGAYYTWLMIKLQPWWSKLLTYAAIEEKLTGATITVDSNGAEAAVA